MTTVNELITDAYYKSGIVSPDAESPDARQISDGLKLLNEVLNEIAINGKLIPYIYDASINTVPGQESYDLQDGTSQQFSLDFVKIKTVSLVWNNIRYYLEEATETEYKTNPRSLNISSLPYQYYIQRQRDTVPSASLQASHKISFYFVPNEIYTINISGLIQFSQINLSSSLDKFDLYYINFLEYKLADRLCLYNSLDTPPRLAQHLISLESKISNITNPDLITRKSGLLKDNVRINYADVNIGHGWRP